MKISEFVKISNSSVTLIVLIVTVSSFLANPNSTTNLIILLPLIGAGYLMSMSAVLFNNIYDRDVDGLMDRTSFRVPLVNENLAKLKFISILSFALGFAVAFLLINYLATIFLTLGLLSYSVLYTVILKRKTVLNIVIGSIAGSFASLSGWMSGGIVFDLFPVLISLFVFAWMSFHFLVFSLVHSEDYKNTDIPMLPARRGAITSIHVISLNAGIVIALSFIPVVLRSGLSLVSYLIIMLLMGSFLVVFTLKLNGRNYRGNFAKGLLNFSVVYFIIMLLSLGFTNIVLR